MTSIFAFSAKAKNKVTYSLVYLLLMDVTYPNSMVVGAYCI